MGQQRNQMLKLHWNNTQWQQQWTLSSQFTLAINIQNCPYMHWYIYIYIYAYITDAYTLLLHVLALLECYHQGIFTAAVLKKWSDVGGDFVHMLCTYSSAFKVGFISWFPYYAWYTQYKNNSFHAAFNLENKCINLSPCYNNLNHITTLRSRVLPYELKAPQQLKIYLKHFLKPKGSLMWSKKSATSPNPAPN